MATTEIVPHESDRVDSPYEGHLKALAAGIDLALGMYAPPPGRPVCAVCRAEAGDTVCVSCGVVIGERCEPLECPASPRRRER